jgi:general secretion pathway protein G
MLLTTVRRPTDRRSGFTLMEVLVVVAILVILATVATIATTRYLEDAKKTKAQLGCKAVADAIQNFTNNPANTMNEPPSGLQDLLNPHFGGTGYLKNGQQDLMDPWGQQYQMQQMQQGDGSMTILVYTHSKDNPPVPISQYGIGPSSRVSH